MAFSVPSIDPFYALSGNINPGRITSKADAEKQFVSVFLSEIFKGVFKSQNSLLGDDQTSAFSDDLYNDILMSKITKDMADSKAYGIDKLLAEMNRQ